MQLAFPYTVLLCLPLKKRGTVACCMLVGPFVHRPSKTFLINNSNWRMLGPTDLKFDRQGS